MKKTTAEEWLKNPENLEYLEKSAPTQEQMANLAQAMDAEIDLQLFRDEQIHESKKWVNAAKLIAYLPEKKILYEILNRPLHLINLPPNLGQIKNRGRIGNSNERLLDIDLELSAKIQKAINGQLDTQQHRELFEVIISLTQFHGLTFEAIYLVKVIAIAITELEYTRDDIMLVLNHPERATPFVAYVLQRTIIEAPGRLPNLRITKPSVDSHGRSANEALYQYLTLKSRDKRTQAELCAYLEVDPKTIRKAFKEAQSTSEDIILQGASGSVTITPKDKP